MIPTLIVIYSTSYWLVNKRLPVKLQKPYGASSGIVSIVAIRQSRQATAQIAPTIPNSPYPIIHGDGRSRLKPACGLFVMYITNVAARRAPAIQFRPNDADLLLTVCYVGLHNLSVSSIHSAQDRGP
ncbi:hypothetical protein CPU03_01165 [Edwardsiella tarda]|uniref:Uncharacterized protein n=1 Tax=Edwardsiella tarda TaxID=636 RepID=A0A2A7U3S3_EDWTA|nr:hypothetical protein CPU03_01165 [Edwardsiella tarda]PEH72969.1 hypothetical protein CRM76_14020 [Edwardsiella tarda]